MILASLSGFFAVGDSNVSERHSKEFENFEFIFLYRLGKS
jgi:hypothetical protein